MEFTGQLYSNEIFTGLFNAILSRQTFADNVKHNFDKLLNRARTEGSLYGDQLLFYSTDCLFPEDFIKDGQIDNNVLETHYPKDPECQALRVNVFKQIRLTLDNYLSKRAWGSPESFNQFMSVMMSWIQNTKHVYDATTINTFIGNAESNIGKQAADKNKVKIGANDDLGLKLAQKQADLITDMGNYSREYNDYGHMRAYAPEDLVVVYNSKYYNEIKNVNLPVIYHQENLLEKLDTIVLPETYFGNGGNATEQTGDTNETVRAGDAITLEDGTKLFAGEAVPNGKSVPANLSYTMDQTIAFKVLHKDSIKYLSSFEVATSWFNPKSLAENHYLTFGRNKLEYLKNYPLITVVVEEV